MQKILLIVLCVLVSGCSEGHFELSKDSRLPKWFEVPKNMTREDVTVTLDTYLFPFEKSVFTLYDSSWNKLSVVEGKRLGGYLSPKKLKSPPSGFPKGYPSYEVIISDETVDIIEHRKMEPVFFTTDDLAVWSEIGPKTN